MKSTVQVVEVGPRDGLQNEREVIDTPAKIALINRVIDAGARRIEVASFVNPRRVPQMADGDAVIAALPDRKDVSYIGLCLNLRGVERAIASRDGGARGVDEAGCVLVASDTFGIRNQGQTIVEGIAANRDMLAAAKRAGLVPQVTISAAFGCPFEGDVPAQRIVDLAKAMAEAGAVEIALADTIGVGVPAQVSDLFGAVAAAVPGIRLRAHFHDTRGTGIANAWAAYNAGVHVLDASVGGIGGCPFAPKATGNIATEDLLYMLDNSGVSTGVDLSAMIGVNRWFAGILGRELPSRVARAAA
ncbi:hydroxymethylglutaryl-CoA lyase [Polymorphobacter sp. PAMC 29334]|uniref:hydroxymethylglutaryl-CoA lyase n=1 Tax=Polymorphobacter sp. PAMC 29334 TaxID=2862331 RepID=UPI001C684743|nr:hydroxymethylglutaryl-CoA lyase [Polymorphobacter sp. PAMC 29334]QYE33784.1 hydroxymethylglutaryl-CoA lyase [Polymorphobacter sp. PAMC 29334]